MPNRTVGSEAQKKAALIELINQINMCLKTYEVSRKPLSETGRKWGYFFLIFTGLLAFPFFRALFRNDELTRKKIATVEATQEEFRKITKLIPQETSLNLNTTNAYLDNIVKDLLDLQINNNDLNNYYEKFHLSKQQVLILSSKSKPTYFQSGLTLAIESCFTLIEDFRKKYGLFPSSTVQVSANLGNQHSDRNSRHYIPPPAYSASSAQVSSYAPYPAPPAFNPNAEQENPQRYQPSHGSPTYRWS
ncbi:MAG: hypothetical protein V4501_12985 [Pseudomonadota bacterium]